jgi:Protein of unknown function (DUF2878)
VSVTPVLLTVAALHVGWFACVLGAARGLPFTGPLVVLCIVAVQLFRQPRSARLLRTLIGAAALGVLFDGTLAMADVLQFPAHAAVGWPAPVWMIALWVNLGLALDDLLWLRRHPVACAVGGAVSGALSYLAGARLGAVVLGPTESTALGLVALEWAVALPLLLRWADAPASRVPA